MRKIRIGKDIQIQWGILTNGETTSLEGRNLKLVLTTPLKNRLQLDFLVVGNMIMSLYKGVEQKILGRYTLTLWENLGLDNQSAVDMCNAFELVSSSCLEDDDDVGLAISLLELTTQQHIDYYIENVTETNDITLNI